MDTSISTLALLFAAATVGGALNAVAGGGSFFSFPALLLAGIPPIQANATSAVALWPGSAASVGAYRRELARQPRAFVVWMSAVSFVGGLLGALLLLDTPQATFSMLIPYLLLAATLLFAFSKPLISWFRGRRARSRYSAHWDEARATAIPASLDDASTLRPPATWQPQGRASLAMVSLVQLGITVYAGYFGGGAGIMMLAAFGLLGMENIHEMNAIKTALAVCANGVAVVAFIAAGVVFWQEALVMLVGAITGGYGCATLARRLNPGLVRAFVIVVGAALTVYFFVR